MSNKTIFFIGILGAGLFVVAAILGGLLIEDYNFTSQYISESYASGTKAGPYLRFLGFIPSGILLTIFAFAAAKKFPASKLIKLGFYGLGIFYGIATISTGIFPCDSGCSTELLDPSISQVIHNLVGLLTYMFVPLSIFLIGLGLKNFPSYKSLSIQGIAYGLISMLCVFILFSSPTSEYVGLTQRIIETIFIMWIISCAFALKNIKQDSF
jgi:hypothetical protein